MRSRCMICGRYIRDDFWVCEPCAKAYGLGVPYTRWPEWAKYMCQEERIRRRRRDAAITETAVSNLNDAERAIMEKLFCGEVDDE
jgi:hypothetical protein